MMLSEAAERHSVVEITMVPLEAPYGSWKYRSIVGSIAAPPEVCWERVIRTPKMTSGSTPSSRVP